MFTAEQATELAKQEKERLLERLYDAINGAAAEGHFQITEEVPDGMTDWVKAQLENVGYHIDFYPTDVGMKTFVITWPTT